MEMTIEQILEWAIKLDCHIEITSSGPTKARELVGRPVRRVYFSTLETNKKIMNCATGDDIRYIKRALIERLRQIELGIMV